MNKKTCPTAAVKNVGDCENNKFQFAAQNSLGESMDVNKITIEFDNIKQKALSDINTVATIEALRTHEPTSPGELSLVIEYDTGYDSGGGIFLYDAADTTSEDDYGVTIVTAGGARWKRLLNDYNDVNVTFFGALADGATDCLEAVNRMWNWSQKNYPYIGIKFPAGTFMISKFDISGSEVSRFRLVGHQVNFGYFPATTLVSDRANNEVMFTVKASHTEISSLIINGETDTAQNTKGFFKNIATAGQYVRATSLLFNNLGGRGLDMLDTLDCKIDQWYSSKCSGTIIYATWSGTGSWDHITAIELSNFNVQYQTVNPAIDLQRATQSLIWNGWIEHSAYPGNIANGEWTINALSMEDCANPLVANYAQLILNQINLHGESSIDLTETGDRWTAISEYEMGHVHTENHGISVDGSMSYQYLSGSGKMDNRTESDKWFYLGEVFHSQISVQTKIRLDGSASYNSIPTTQTGYTTRTAEGTAVISLQTLQDGSFVGTWCGEGAAPVTRVALQPGTSSNRIGIFVKVATYTGYCTAQIETNDFDRFTAGVHFRFYPGYRAATAEEIATLEALPDNCFHQHWSGKNGVGFGFNNDNQLLLAGQTLPVSGFNEATQCLQVYVNNTLYGIELRPLSS